MESTAVKAPKGVREKVQLLLETDKKIEKAEENLAILKRNRRRLLKNPHTSNIYGMIGRLEKSEGGSPEEKKKDAGTTDSPEPPPIPREPKRAAPAEGSPANRKRIHVGLTRKE